jgi:hypothetical protein
MVEERRRVIPGSVLVIVGLRRERRGPSRHKEQLGYDRELQ